MPKFSDRSLLHFLPLFVVALACVVRAYDPPPLDYHYGTVKNRGSQPVLVAVHRKRGRALVVEVKPSQTIVVPFHATGVSVPMESNLLRYGSGSRPLDLSVSHEGRGKAQNVRAYDEKAVFSKPTGWYDPGNLDLGDPDRIIPGAVAGSDMSQLEELLPKIRNPRKRAEAVGDLLDEWTLTEQYGLTGRRATALRMLQKAKGDEDPRVRQAAKAVDANRSKIETLEGALSRGDRDAVTAALPDVLKITGRESVLTKAWDRMGNGDEKTAVAAAAYEQVGGRSPLVELLKCAEGESESDRWHALNALADMGNEKGLDMLRADLTNTEDPDAQWGAACVLTRAGDMESLDGLCDLSRRLFQRAEDNDDDRDDSGFILQEMVRGMLHQAKTEEVRAALETSSSYGARGLAAAELGKRGNAEDVPLLKKALSDPERRVRWQAEEALKQIGGPAAEAALKEAAAAEAKREATEAEKHKEKDAPGASPSDWGSTPLEEEPRPGRDDPAADAEFMLAKTDINAHTADKITLSGKLLARKTGKPVPNAHVAFMMPRPAEGEASLMELLDDGRATSRRWVLVRTNNQGIASVDVRLGRVPGVQQFGFGPTGTVAFDELKAKGRIVISSRWVYTILDQPLKVAAGETLVVRGKVVDFEGNAGRLPVRFLRDSDGAALFDLTDARVPGEGGNEYICTSGIGTFEVLVKAGRKIGVQNLGFGKNREFAQIECSAPVTVYKRSKIAPTVTVTPTRQSVGAGSTRGITFGLKAEMRGGLPLPGLRLKPFLDAKNADLYGWFTPTEATTDGKGMASFRFTPNTHPCNRLVVGLECSAFPGLTRSQIRFTDKPDKIASEVLIPYAQIEITPLIFRIVDCPPNAIPGEEVEITGNVISRTTGLTEPVVGKTCHFSPAPGDGELLREYRIPAAVSDKRGNVTVKVMLGDKPGLLRLGFGAVSDYDWASAKTQLPILDPLASANSGEVRLLLTDYTMIKEEAPKAPEGKGTGIAGKVHVEVKDAIARAGDDGGRLRDLRAAAVLAIIPEATTVDGNAVLTCRVNMVRTILPAELPPEKRQELQKQLMALRNALRNRDKTEKELILSAEEKAAFAAGKPFTKIAHVRGLGVSEWDPKPQWLIFHLPGKKSEEKAGK